MTKDAAKWFVENEHPQGIVLSDECRQFCVFRNKHGQIRYKPLNVHFDAKAFENFIKKTQDFLGVTELPYGGVSKLPHVED